MVQDHIIHITDLSRHHRRPDHQGRRDRRDHPQDQYRVQYRRDRRLEYGDLNTALWTEIRKIINR